MPYAEFDTDTYFTIVAEPPPEILIISPDQNSARLWSDALAPKTLIALKKNRCQCKVAPLNTVDSIPSETYATIS